MITTNSLRDRTTPTGWRSVLLRSAAGVALATLSALLLWLAFPPYGLWPLIWVGFVPMLLAQHRVLPAKLSSLAPAISLGGFFGAMFAPVFAGLPEITSVMRWLPLAVGALVFVLQRQYRAFHTRTGYCWLPLQSTVSWVAITFAGAIPLTARRAARGAPVRNARSTDYVG